MRSLGFTRGLLVLSTTALACACSGAETFPTGSGGSGATGGAGSGGAGGTGGGVQVCGDGVQTSPELCDDGNETNGDGCDNDCSFSCTKGTPQGDAKCDDGDPCNGAETCSAGHVCVPGQDQPSGTPCGVGLVCKAGVCGDISCGDGFVDPGEDCDDGNLDPADGCDACSFTCVVDSDCDPADVCAGTGECAADHTCSAVGALPDGTGCPGGGVCASGACVVPVCGNGTPEPTEGCDDGNLVSGDGCDDDCQPTCADPAVDCPAPPPCNEAACTAQDTCTIVADIGQNGTVCGQDLICAGGACIGDGAVCGNGALEAGEDCDFGAGNGPGTGCETTCKFSCAKTPDACADKNPCNGVEMCSTVVVGGKLGQKCSPGSPLPACASCGAGLCLNGTCVASACGDGCIDAAKGEGCEPPGTPGCDAACKKQVCGNGVRETGEHCDDANTANLDGCSATCKLEQIHRLRYLVLQYATDTFCPKNQLGAAIVGAPVQSQLQLAINEGVQSADIDVLLQFLGLDDLTGVVDPAVQIGVMNGFVKVTGPYDGTNDLDYWHGIHAASVDSNKVPIVQIPGQITAKQLTAGPGSISITVPFGGAPSPMSLSAVQLSIVIGASSAPLVSSTNQPPGHMPGENLDPGLVSFATAGQTNANGAGKLCGNVSAASLAVVPVPEALTSGPFACAEGYGVQSTMLDVIVGGCTVFGVPQVQATQPDLADPVAPPVGAGAPYTLVAGAQGSVTACKDKNGGSVPLAACLSVAAYSSFFKVATNRVIVR